MNTEALAWVGLAAVAVPAFLATLALGVIIGAVL